MPVHSLFGKQLLIIYINFISFDRLQYNQQFQMDSPVNNQQDKKLADVRKQLTPGGDDSYDEIGSEEQQSNLYEKTSSNHYQVQSKQELWEDTSMLEKGQSQSLRPLNVNQKILNESLTKEFKEQQQKQEPIEKQQQQKSQNNRKNKRSYLQKEPKPFRVDYDSKFIFAAYELLYQEFRKQITPQMGFLKFNPYLNMKQIIIYYYDDDKKDVIAQIVDNNINDLEVMQMSKLQAESGVQLSFKYRQELLKQKISFFKDKTQNFKNASYYICGYKVKKNILYQKIAQLKKINFIWMHLFRFQDTRSYRAILRKLFDTPQMHTFILQKFKAKEIQIACIKRDFPLPSNTDKKGVLIVMTIQGQKKITIHQQIQQLLSTFIRQTFLVFCFTFIRRKQFYKYQYTPKVQKVIWFFIQEKNIKTPTSYLYILVSKKDFLEVKETIIKQIESMKLDIISRRFFKYFYPDLKDKQSKANERIYGFPKIRPYSWTLTTPKGVKFDWVSQLKI